MRRTLFRSFRILPIVVAIPFAAHAQAREITLGAPNATNPFEFSLIRGVRELSNGSVLVASPIDGILMHLDPTLKRADTLGRKGRGPGEYIQPDGIWPLAGDSSMLVDLGNNRLSLILPNGRFGNVMPLLTPGEGGPGGMTVMLPGGMDGNGGLYFRGGPGGDSVPLQRYDRATKQTKRVAMLKATATQTKESGDVNSRSQRNYPVPLSPADGWAVTRSGTVYLVRSGTYRVETVSPQGVHKVGGPVSYTPVRIGDAEKKEYQDATNRDGGLQIGVESRNGETTFSLSRGRARPDEASSIPFPATKPPFDPSQIYVDSKDRLWVRRYQPAGKPALYDVFDTQGAQVASVRFPAGRQIVGTGASSLYVVHITDDDLQLLERYALPL